MRYIANILTNGRFENKELFNVVKQIDDIDNKLPTLVIGWECVKKFFGNANTMDWRIKDNIYWTFGTRERRDRNERDVAKFTLMVTNEYSSSVKYSFINIFRLSKDDKIKLVNKIKTTKHGTFYFYNDVVYLNLDIDNVIGISLKDIDYCGCDRKKLLSIIYRNRNLNQITNEMVPISIRKTFISTVYVIPTLFF